MNLGVDFAQYEARLWMSAGGTFYLLAFAYALWMLWRGRVHSSLSFHVLLVLGFVLQSVGLYARGLVLGAFPLKNTYEIVQVIVWTLVLLEMVLRPMFSLRLLGFFTSGLAGLLSLLSSAISGWDYVHGETLSEAHNPWVGFHAGVAIFSYGIFSLLAVTSFMYLLQHHALRRKRLGGVFLWLPSIRQLDEMGGRLLLMGVSVFTVAVASGIVNWLHVPSALGAAKLGATCLLWVCYVGACVWRVRQGLFGVRFAWVSLLLFGCALLALWPVTIDMRLYGKEGQRLEVREHDGR